MKCVNRYLEYKDESLDQIMLKIRNGTIKCGRYSHLVKIKKNDNVKGKELFNNGSDDN